MPSWVPSSSIRRTGLLRICWLIRGSFFLLLAAAIVVSFQ